MTTAFEQQVLNGNLREDRLRAITIIRCLRCSATWERQSGDGYGVAVADRDDAVRHISHHHPDHAGVAA